MLKFNQLTAKDKKNRYKKIVDYAGLAGFVFLIYIGINHMLFGLFLVIIMIFDLLFYGVLNGKGNYKYKNLLLDAVLLLAINLFSTLVLSPMMVTGFHSIGTYSFLDREMSAGNLFVSVLLIQLLWYAAVIIQDKRAEESVRWKWRATNLLSSPDFDEI